MAVPMVYQLAGSWAAGMVRASVSLWADCLVLTSAAKRVEWTVDLLAVLTVVLLAIQMVGLMAVPLAGLMDGTVAALRVVWMAA